MKRTVEIVKDPQELADKAAGHIIKALRKAIESRDVASLALSGGSTPERAYHRLAERRNEVDWARVRVFLSDERFVPLDSADSNFRMAARALISQVPVPLENVFPVDVQSSTAEEAARSYEATLTEHLGPTPSFDLILLGLGDDGHTASLFPSAPSLAVTDRWVVASPPGTLPPPVERVTFTFPALNAAKEILFLVSGERKGEVVQKVLESPADCQTRPASCVSPTDGTVTWLLDRAAASRLRSDSHQ